MASIAFDKATGRRTVQFVDDDGKRKSIRLGPVPARVAEQVKLRVEAILAARRAAVPIDAETARWIGSLGPVLRDRLAAAGLVEASTSAGIPRLGDFLESYVSMRMDIKQASRVSLRQGVASVLAFFGADRKLADITLGDAEEFRLRLKESLADNTARRRCAYAKQFFAFAVRKRYIPSNPFADLKGCHVRENRARDYFVTREEAAAVLEACPDTDWRLIFGLCRLGGLRCPSEIMGLTWADVDWERGRMTVRSPKTEHHEGKDSRTLPLFPELRPLLDAAFEQAPEGAMYVVARHREASVNLRTQLHRIIRRAGLTPWPKLFHNLRATRETELAATFPLHVVCEWIGNSQPIAARHYLRVTDADFEKAVQNPVQQGAASGRIDTQVSKHGEPQQPELQDVAALCGNMQGVQMGTEGFEPPTSTV